MEENIIKVLEYNTHRSKMTLPEYGRGVQKMVEYVKTIEDRAKRTEQAQAIVNVMEILNPAIRMQDNWAHTLWDHLFIIANYDLDIDSPYPMPEKKTFEEAPAALFVMKKNMKARHYGRNIESIIDLIAAREDGEVKTAMICDLAIYMRTQYLIWNKDSVSDKTIFDDIEKLSDGRITVPEGIELTQVSQQASFNRPGLNFRAGNRPAGKNNKQGKKGGFRKRK